MRDIVIIGTGGFAREVTWLIERNNSENNEWNILGYIDSNYEDKRLNYPILGDDDWLLQCKRSISTVICVGNSQLRRKISQKFKNATNVSFPSIISRDAIVGSNNLIKTGCIICAGSIVTVNAVIDDFSIINLDCTIGHEAHLNKYATLYPSVNVSGNVNIGEASEIGTGSAIIQGINIGEETIVGANATVIRDIPGRCTAVGSPAKVIK